jgi:hypothetical protein
LKQDGRFLVAGVADADVLIDRQNHIDLILSQTWLDEHDGS